MTESVTPLSSLLTAKFGCFYAKSDLLSAKTDKLWLRSKRYAFETKKKERKGEEKELKRGQPEVGFPLWIYNFQGFADVGRLSS